MRYDVATAMALDVIAAIHALAVHFPADLRRAEPLLKGVSQFFGELQGDGNPGAALTRTTEPATQTDLPP